MLRKLFRPKWQHDRPAVRLEALKLLNPGHQDHHDIIRRMAEADTSNEVRCAAIAKLEDLQILQTVRTDGSEDVREAAASQMQHLLAGLRGKLDAASRQAALQHCTEQDLCQIACLCADQDIVDSCLSLINNPADLVAIALASSSAQVRQQIANQISDEDSLRQLSQGMKGRDKRALQICREKLQLIREHETLKQQWHTRQVTLCEQMESLAGSDFYPQYSAKFHLLAQQWTEIPANEIFCSERFEKARLRCEQVMELQNAEQQAQQKHQQETAAANTECLQVLAELDKIMAQLQLGEPLAETVEECRSATEILKQRWESHVNTASPEPSRRRLFDRQLQSINALLNSQGTFLERSREIEQTLKAAEQAINEADFQHLSETREQAGKLLEYIAWPDNTSRPARLEQLRESDALLGKQLQQLKSESRQIAATIKEQLDTLEHLIDQADLNEAKSTSASIRKRLARLGIAERSGLESRLRSLSAQLDNILDWKDFATDPKREELCEHMEKLIDTEIPAPEKAAEIKELQRQWKALGGSRSSQASWERFKSAAEKAYLPCAEYFGEQQQQREENLLKRDRMLNQLDNYIQATDWSLADWKLVEKTLQVAQDEWRRLAPVDRKAGRETQARFRQLSKEIKARLQQERQKNHDRKLALISQVQQLATQEDWLEAISRTKTIQQEWKTIGIDFRRENQALWEQFRSACDAVFARRIQAHQEAEHERQQGLEEAGNICSSIRRLASLADDALQQSRAQYRELQTQWADIGTLSSKDRRAVQQDYTQACDAYEQAFAGIEQRQHLREHEALERCAAPCERLDQLAGDDDSRQHLISNWQAQEALPAPWWESLNQRFQRSVTDADPQTRATNTRALRLLCIKSEILADRPTPEEDQPLRMEWQMQQLTEGLGRARDEVDIWELYREWFFTGPNEADSYQTLKTRFLNNVRACIQQHSND